MGALRLHLILAAAALAQQSAAPQRFPVEAISVEGAKAYQPGAIVAASGLSKGQLGDSRAFDVARDRLIATGAFVTVGYRYSPSLSGKGYAVVFEVAEVEQLLPYRFERLPVPEAQIRAHLRGAIPLFSDKVPASQQVLDLYRDAVQALLKSKGATETVRARVNSDAPNDLHVVFLPAGALPAVAEVYFKGNKVLAETALQSAITGTAIGAEYTEKRFREILNLGVRPIYEARGRVRVAFTRIETAPAKDVKGVAVTVTVDEGESYSLGEVRVQGAGDNKIASDVLRAVDLKTGEVLNLDQITAGQEKINQFMRRNGFMKAASTVERNIRDKEKLVDISYQVEPGLRYTFGKLVVKGLDLHGDHEVRRIWGMAAGKPFNAEYPTFFLAKLNEEGLFDDLGKAESKVALNDGDLTAEVTLIFHATPISPEEKAKRRSRPK